MKTRTLCAAGLLLVVTASIVQGADWRTAVGKTLWRAARAYGKEFVTQLPVDVTIEILKEYVWAPLDKKGPPPGPRAQPGKQPPPYTAEDVEKIRALYERMVKDPNVLAQLDRDVAANVERWEHCRSTNPDLRIRGCTAILDRGNDSNVALATARNNRGYAYYETGDHGQAKRDYDAALSLNPDAWITYVNRGVIAAHARQFDPALSDFTRALQGRPDYALAYYNRGKVHDELGQYDLAIADYSASIRLDPSYVDAFVNRAAVHADRGQYQEALRDLDAAMKRRPRYALAYWNRGRTWHLRGWPDRAAADFARAVELDRVESCRLLAQWAEGARYARAAGCPAR